MRPKTLISSSLIIAFTFSLLSCKKTIVNELKINDFASVKAEFKTPSAEYTTSPFFVWNYKITKDEIDKFLADFKNEGISQVFVHPRPGLITEYLSDEWFDLFKHTVEKGKELGMRIWIYDENSYPSGFAGGHVPYRMPESYNQGQGLQMTKFETLPDTADKYYLCLKENDGVFVNITSILDAEKGESGKYYLFSKTYNSPGDWYGGFTYVDLLYPCVTERFIDITMEGYEKYTGTDFGKTIPGIFTDEPQIISSGGIRWTPDLFEVFEDTWNYDLRTQLPSLFEDIGDWKKVRHNYTQTLLQLFIDRWSKPYYSYCEEKGLKFTGHYWEHEWPNMRPGGDNMAMYAWHQVPAIDMLFNQFNDSSANAQFGNIRSVKELASAANQTGRQRKLSETYGGSGWELTFRDMKRNGDWEYALGVNLMNQHLTYFSLAGARKYDYPPTFDYHEPWWQDYKYLGNHYARLSMALSAGKQENDILVIEPTTSAWLYDSYVMTLRDRKFVDIGESFTKFVTTLEKNQVEYDLGSENIIKDRGSVKTGQFIIGQARYSTVVIPPMTENIDKETYKLISKLVAGGGKLICFSHPSLVDGSPNEHLEKFLEENKDKIRFETELTPEIISKYFTSPDICFSDVKGGQLYHHRRILSDGQVLFLVNSSLNESATGSLTTRGADALELNTLTGEINGYENTQEGRNVNLSFNLPPAGSLLLYVPFTKQGSFEVLEKLGTSEPISSSGLSVSRDRANVLPIEFCDLQIGNEVTKDMHNYDAAERVYKYYGFINGNPWNHSVQFKTNIVDRDTFGLNTGFTATYHFNIKGNIDLTGLKAVVERPSLWDVSINGKEVKAEEGKWWLDREFGVIDLEKLVKRGENTITLKVSPMTVNAEIEPVYILGNFSVNPADKGWIIEPIVNKLTMGSWKDQGMPFYSWGVIYSKEYNIEEPDGRYMISLEDWQGTVAEVTINDQPAGVIAIPPYHCEVTQFIKKGKNKIEIKVIGSLKNLLGPHFNNPSPGLVGPWHFRNVKSYPAGKDYQLFDYGLMQEFVLLHGK
jgi:hypothetical protein